MVGVLDRKTFVLPYIVSRAELDKYIERYVLWHWHKTVELFYMENGNIEYDTPEAG